MARAANEVLSVLKKKKRLAEVYSAELIDAVMLSLSPLPDSVLGTGLWLFFSGGGETYKASHFQLLYELMVSFLPFQVISVCFPIPLSEHCH